ncbi:YbaB/EbfC family nucleoid-associated protein [Streptomyces sp. NPDC002911]
MDDIEQRMKEADEQFAAQWQQVQQVQRELAALSVTRRSMDRSVEVTVGAQGELSGLRFINDKYQSMTAQQLAGSILDAAAAARLQILEQANQRLSVIPGIGAVAMTGGLEDMELDLDALLAPLRAEGVEVPAMKDPADRKKSEEPRA